MAMTSDQFQDILAEVLGGKGGKNRWRRGCLGSVRDKSSSRVRWKPRGWGALGRALQARDQGIRAASVEAYTAFMYAEANDILPNGEGLGAEDLGISAKFAVILERKCKGDALAIFK